MSTGAETINNLTPEEVLGPPKYDRIGILMTFLSALISGVISGIIIILASYFAIGPFSLQSGASPILLAFVAFIGLTIGNLIYASLLGYIFPHIYGRHKTILSQVMIASIILYVFFIPVYIVITSSSTELRIILIAFSTHVSLNAFMLIFIMGVVSRYRYSLLSFYSSLISLLVTSMIVIYVYYQMTKSETSLFIFLGLPVLTIVLSSLISTLLSWLYYIIYQSTGSDPLGSVFGGIEDQERDLEKQAINSLTNFSK